MDSGVSATREFSVFIVWENEVSISGEKNGQDSKNSRGLVRVFKPLKLRRACSAASVERQEDA